MVFLEAVRRRRRDPRVESAVHFAGFVLLIALMLVISIREVTGGAQ